MPEQTRITDVYLTADVARELDRILNKNKSETSGEVIYKVTANFGDGIEADIKLVTSESGPFIDAVLFDSGSEVQCLEPGNFDKFTGSYKFKYNNIEYIVNITAK